MNAATNDLQNIYRERVLEHSRNPHNFGRPDNPDREATGFNPLCGDKLTVYLQLTDDDINSAAFEGAGCAICISSASMMTVAMHNRSTEEAHRLIVQAQKMFDAGIKPQEPALQDIQALDSVRKYPSRIKCATLAWTTVEAALNGDTGQVSTETQDK